MMNLKYLLNGLGIILVLLAPTTYAKNPCSDCESTPGPQGPAGPSTPSSDAGNQLTTGSDGLLYYQSRVVAFAKILSNGSVSKSSGVTASRTGIGRYRVTFSDPRPDNNYIIQLTVFGANTAPKNDANIYILTGSQTNTDFRVGIDSNDDGGSSGNPTDSDFMVAVIDSN